jgi:hypothetical protein
VGDACAVSDRRTDARASVWLWTSALLTLGALAAGAALAPPATASPVQGLTWLLFLGSSAHVAATAYLLTLPGVRAHARAHPGRYLCAPAGLIALAALVAVLLRPSQYGWVLLPYFCWQFSHFQKQNIGVVALAGGAVARHGPGPAERRALSLAGWAGILALASRPALLQLHIDPHLGLLYDGAAALTVVAVCGGVRALLARPRAERPPGYCVVSLTSLCFFAPVFLFHSPYAAVAGMTIAHGLQYLLLVGMMSGGGGASGRTGGGRGGDRVVGVAAFVTIALLGGIALSAASHLHGGPAAERILFGLYLGLVMTHFVVDAGLWRLRQPFPRALLASRLPYLVAPSVPTPSDPGPSVPGPSVPGTRHSALGTRHSALGTRHSALGTRHSDGDRSVADIR